MMKKIRTVHIRHCCIYLLYKTPDTLLWSFLAAVSWLKKKYSVYLTQCQWPLLWLLSSNIPVLLPTTLANSFSGDKILLHLLSVVAFYYQTLSSGMFPAKVMLYSRFILAAETSQTSV